VNEEGKSHTEALRRAGARTDRRARGADWAVGIAAAVLLLVSVGGYLYHRDQLASIAVEHLRLRVCAPPSLGIDRPAEIHVLTTGLTGKPVAALVEIALLAPDDKPILHRTDQAGEDGRFRLAIPAGLELPEESVRLEVTASRNGARETFEARLAAEPARYRTCLATDRPSYRAGHTVFYRSVTLSRFELAEGPDQTVQFEFQDAEGRPLPNSAYTAATTRGVGHGAFTLPADLPGGEIFLVAQSAQGRFPEARLRLAIGHDAAEEGIPADAPAGVQVAFYPEGGALAPDLENRVYFTARDARGQPIELKGLVLDAADTPVAAIETIGSGMGVFSFRPQPGGGYRLKIAEPEEVEVEPELPEIDPRRNLLLSAGVGVFRPGKPLEFALRAAEDGVPLVVAAWCRGNLVGQKPVVTRVLGDDEPQDGVPGAGGVNQVALAIPDEVSGLIGLIVYDYSTRPPAPVARRWVYRRPAGRLQLSAVADVERAAVGGRATVTVRVTDESGEPAPAVLAISAVDKARIGPADEQATPLPACFLLGCTAHAVPRRGRVALNVSGDAEPDVALDLLLGTCAGLPADASDTDNDDARRAAAFDAAPPLVFDNLLPLRREYEETLAQYRRHRTRALNMLTTLSFFGGFGLVLAVAMLGLLGVVSGVRLWIPAGGAAVCCLLIGAIVLAPLRRDEHLHGDAAFLSFVEPTPVAEEGLPAAEALPEPSRPALLAPPFAYDREVGAPADTTELSGTLLWHPLLVVDDSGQAEVQFDLPEATTDIRIRVEAHGAGRLAAVATCTENADPIY